MLSRLDIDTAAFDARLGRTLAQFRADDLAAMADACDAMDRELDAVAPPAVDAMRARLCDWAARRARRRERPDDAMRQLYAGLSAARRAAAGPITSKTSTTGSRTRPATRFCAAWARRC